MVAVPVAGIAGDLRPGLAALAVPGALAMALWRSVWTLAWPQTHHDAGLVARGPSGQDRTMAATARGRSCPISYRLRPEDLAGPATCSATTLYVIGGLYGSVAALDAVLGRVAQDGPAVVVFNGDFHYLDVAEEDFLRIADGVSGHLATRGNVETELITAGDDGGCGCGYPDYVDDGTVERSNAVMSRLRETAQRHPALIALMAELPRQLVVEVGGLRVAVLHGDPEQSAGWRLALEAMEPGDDDVRSWTGFEGATTSAGQVAVWLRRGRVQVLACTHTGLPYAQDVALDGSVGLVVNNGSAGLPCFAGLQAGVMTRLSTDPRPPDDALYGLELDGVRCDALPVRYDVERRHREFVASWPTGTAAHVSYAERLLVGTPLRLEQAARGAVHLVVRR